MEGRGARHLGRGEQTGPRHRSAGALDVPGYRHGELFSRCNADSRVNALGLLPISWTVVSVLFSDEEFLVRATSLLTVQQREACVDLFEA